ncbi:hypothetical protein EV401DRAFT_1884384 [Pisolithus croceorrhizus]|nr:hypothetical protein EV401DRAFT_1884384 [Pisolithus croceorrhizus]
MPLGDGISRARVVLSPRSYYSAPAPRTDWSRGTLANPSLIVNKLNTATRRQVPEISGQGERFKHADPLCIRSPALALPLPVSVSQPRAVYVYIGDGVACDEHDYTWIKGHVHNAINMYGYRFSTAEIKSALIFCKGVTEAAVTSTALRPHVRNLSQNVGPAAVIVNDLYTNWHCRRTDKCCNMMDHTSYHLGDCYRRNDPLHDDLNTIAEPNAVEVIRKVTDSVCGLEVVR